MTDPSPRDIEITNEIFECTQSQGIDPHTALDHWEVALIIKAYREELLNVPARR